MEDQSRCCILNHLEWFEKFSIIYVDKLEFNNSAEATHNHIQRRLLAWERLAEMIP